MPIQWLLDIFPRLLKYVKLIAEWSFAALIFYFVLLDPKELFKYFSDSKLLFPELPVSEPGDLFIKISERKNLLNLPENEVLWFARKFYCKYSNCPNDLIVWEAFYKIEYEWVYDNSTADDLWIPLTVKDSTQLEIKWRKLIQDSVTPEDSNPITIMNGLYFAHLGEDYGYLSPNYWEKENGLWIIMRSECSWKISEPPPISYFSQITPNTTMNWYYQPIPAWYLKKSDDQISDGKHSSKDIFCSNMFSDDSENDEYTDVIFVVHGIGHHESEKGIVKNTNDIRNGFTNYVKKFHKNLNIPFIIPIPWRFGLTLNDEIILASPAIKWPQGRNFGLSANDVMYYCKGYKEEIQNALIEILNSKYQKFKEGHPNFKGKISILAHSLGSVITYDVLNDKSDKLQFTVQNIFLIGSPLARFLASDGNKASEKLKKNPWIKNGRIFNIFHSFDPVANRLEVLYNLDYKYVQPHKLNFDQKFRKTFWKTTLQSDFEKSEVSKFGRHFVEDRKFVEKHDSFFKYQTVTYEYLKNIMDTQPHLKDYNRTVLFYKNQKENGTIEPLILESTKELEKLPIAKRIPHRFDYDIHKTEYKQNVHEPVGTLTKLGTFAKDVLFYHSSYWESPEVIALMANVMFNISAFEDFEYIEPEPSYFNSFFITLGQIGYFKVAACVTLFSIWAYASPKYTSWYFNERQSNFMKVLDWFSTLLGNSGRPYNLFHVGRYYMGIILSNAIEKAFWCNMFLFPLIPLILSSLSLRIEYSKIIDQIYYLTFFPAIFNLLFAENRICRESICRLFYSIILCQLLTFLCFCELKDIAYVYRAYELQCSNEISKGHCQEYEMFIDDGTFIGGTIVDEGPFILPPDNWKWLNELHKKITPILAIVFLLTVISFVSLCCRDILFFGKTPRMHTNQLMKRFLAILDHADNDINDDDDDAAVIPEQQPEVNTPASRSQSPTPQSTVTPSRSPPSEQSTPPRVQPSPVRRSQRTRNAPDRLKVNPSLKSYH